MSDLKNSPDTQTSTANWRKYPKGPNFFGIVMAASAVIIVLLIAAWFLLRADGTKMIPHGPNPQPNSLMQPRNQRGGVADSVQIA